MPAPDQTDEPSNQSNLGVEVRAALRSSVVATTVLVGLLLLAATLLSWPLPTWAVVVSALFVFAWTWYLRAESFVKVRLRPDNPELLAKLTKQLPILVYQFRTFPTGRSSVTYANEALKTIYEVDPEDAKRDGSLFMKLVHPDDAVAINASLRHSYFTLEPWVGEYRVVLPKGGVQWRFAQATVERLPDGGTLWHGFVADITERKRDEESRRYTERLRIARERSENSDQAKNAFLAMMSHEIRTPMNAVIGFLDLLNGTDCSEDQRSYLESAQSGAQAMLLLMEDFIAVAKSDAGQLEITEVEFEVRSWLDGIAVVMAPKAAVKQLEWKFSIDPETPAMLLSDRARLTQCLMQLLGNAVKFTDSGSVSFAVKVVTGLKAKRLRFEIADTGCGIPSDRLEHVFEPFARADESMARRHGGTGLGLTLCKQISELLGASLTCESTEGKGSTFALELVLPAQSRSDAAASLDSPTAPVPNGPLGLHVLIAEDQKTNQKLLGLLLKRLGCSFEVASNGLEAIEMFRNGDFDMILMDVQMPELDGIGATREIRLLESRDALRTVPIIAVTANAFDTDRDDCLAAGMNDFLSKPVRAELLRVTLATHKGSGNT